MTHASWLERSCQKKQLKSFPNSCWAANPRLGAPTVGSPTLKINGCRGRASGGFDFFSILHWHSHLLPPCTTPVAWLVDFILSKAGERRRFLPVLPVKPSCSWWPSCWSLDGSWEGMSPRSQRRVSFSPCFPEGFTGCRYPAGFRLGARRCNRVPDRCLYHAKINVFSRSFLPFTPRRVSGVWGTQCLTTLQYNPQKAKRLHHLIQKQSHGHCEVECFWDFRANRFM